MSKDWMRKQAAQMMWEAQQVDPENGIQRLVLSLLQRIKPEGRPCRGHGACYITGQCPFNPECTN